MWALSVSSLFGSSLCESRRNKNLTASHVFAPVWPPEPLWGATETPKVVYSLEAGDVPAKEH